MTIILRRRAPPAAGPSSPAPAVIWVDDAIHSRLGRLFCHLFSEDVAALHAFAARIGVKPCWFEQPPQARWPHYDIDSRQRAAALRQGAMMADRYKTVEVSLILQGGLTAERKAWLADLRAKHLVRKKA